MKLLLIIIMVLAPLSAFADPGHNPVPQTLSQVLHILGSFYHVLTLVGVGLSGIILGKMLVRPYRWAIQSIGVLMLFAGVFLGLSV